MKTISTKQGDESAVPGAAPRPHQSQPRLASVRRPEPSARPAGQSGERARSTSQPRPTQDADEPRTGVVRRVDTDGWRCLEWAEPSRKRPRRRQSEANATQVTIVQLAADGELLRQNGPAGWLPEAGDFMHRMSTLLARSLGYGACRSVCLKSERAVLAISAVGQSKVVAVSGPTRSMANVLRRIGME